MGASLLEHRRNETTLEEAKVEPIAMVMRIRMLEWFGHGTGRDETENIRAVVEMKMEMKRPRGRPKLRWNDTSGRNGTRTGNDAKFSARPATPHRETAAKGEKETLWTPRDRPTWSCGRAFFMFWTARYELLAHLFSALRSATYCANVV